jgi:hypothetical protein
MPEPELVRVDCRGEETCRGLETGLQRESSSHGSQRTFAGGICPSAKNMRQETKAHGRRILTLRVDHEIRALHTGRLLKLTVVRRNRAGQVQNLVAFIELFPDHQFARVVQLTIAASDDEADAFNAKLCGQILRASSLRTSSRRVWSSGKAIQRPSPADPRCKHGSCD